ncbi:MAG: response regulator [Candidatus Aureabacteria bacterium]|nr:response regulator [Candidatus Auribacterota bacterium]
MTKKILVVDDDADLRKLMFIRLRKAGYEALGGVDGQEALALARQIVPDLIILDVFLPIIDGVAVARQLRSNKRLQHIPVIFISAADRTLVERVREAGAAGHLAKPFDPEALIGMVKKILG